MIARSIATTERAGPFCAPVPRCRPRSSWRPAPVKRPPARRPPRPRRPPARRQPCRRRRRRRYRPPRSRPPARQPHNQPAQGRAADLVAAQALPATPACGDDDDDLTPAQTEGPHYTPNTPERASLIEPGITGTRLVVTGYVLTTGCKPVARALLDFWHADDQGQYDNATGCAATSLRTTRAATRSRPSCRGCIPAARATSRQGSGAQPAAADNPALLSRRDRQQPRLDLHRWRVSIWLQDAAEGKAAEFNFVLEAG